MANSSRIIVTSIVMLLAFLAISEAVPSLGVELHCRCIMTESKPIGRHIAKVEMIPASSHCDETEIIATLKKTGEEVCLDPNAPWVKRVIEKILSMNKRR
ncbi:permeability factor 2-like [Mugil cephalus]|uniref:permeability factor 2-like n=1 Tax=Mugil cephalus TaxID=48193 RepID=UPI001FB84CE6|nr:permeability factor 2-like [Mugil cephalus]